MMDIFSAGCAITELYNEGHPPLDFSQLLGKENLFHFLLNFGSNKLKYFL